MEYALAGYGYSVSRVVRNILAQRRGEDMKYQETADDHPELCFTLRRVLALDVQSPAPQPSRQHLSCVVAGEAVLPLPR
jgi:hypothetical protein